MDGERKGIMNQEKIGKFIAKKRKEKSITQEELASTLGVTNRSISNWECGKNMPDLSLFKPLCEVLDISLNELLSGEELWHLNEQEYEDNIENTLNYSNQKIIKYKRFMALFLIIMGLIIVVSSIMIFPSESSWSSIYSVFGLIIFSLGIYTLLKMKWFLKLLITICIFICSFGLLLFTDFLNVYFNKDVPMFRISTIYAGDVLYYDTLFYDVYRCYFDTDKEYFVIQKNHSHEIEYLLNICK